MPGDALKKFDQTHDWKLYEKQTRAVKKSRELLGERYVDPWSLTGFTATDSSRIVHSTSREIIRTLQSRTEKKLSIASSE